MAAPTHSSKWSQRAVNSPTRGWEPPRPQPFTSACNYACGHAAHSLSIIKEQQGKSCSIILQRYNLIFSFSSKCVDGFFLPFAVAFVSLLASANPPHSCRHCQNEPRGISVCSKSWITVARRLPVQQLRNKAITMPLNTRWLIVFSTPLALILSCGLHT